MLVHSEFTCPFCSFFRLQKSSSVLHCCREYSPNIKRINYKMCTSHFPRAYHNGFVKCKNNSQVSLNEL